MTAHVHFFPDRKVARRPRRHQGRSAPLELNEAQRAWLGDHGFGPDGPPHDFTDPTVRAELVQALRDCGALPAAPATKPSPAARGTRRVG